MDRHRRGSLRSSKGDRVGRSGRRQMTDRTRSPAAIAPSWNRHLGSDHSTRRREQFGIGSRRTGSVPRMFGAYGNAAELDVLLRPPGCGLFSASTGSSPYARRLHQQMYGTHEIGDVTAQWRKQLPDLGGSPVALLGVPFDTGSGAARGSALGPVGVREALCTEPIAVGVPYCDVGEVFCVPHLLHDGLLNAVSLSSCRKAMFGDADSPLPVSPLSVTEHVVESLLSTFPDPPVIIGIGGDHSISAALALPHLRRHTDKLGILHIDAHDDLSTDRFGVPLTYSSWLRFLDRQINVPALAQVGIECLGGAPDLDARLLQFGNRSACSDIESVTEMIVDWLVSRNIEKLYVSIDVDATAAYAAPATGVPAVDGLEPSAVRHVISAVASRIPLVGGDVVETAPTLAGHQEWSTETTCRTAASYVAALMNCTA